MKGIHVQNLLVRHVMRKARGKTEAKHAKLENRPDTFLTTAAVLRLIFLSLPTDVEVLEKFRPILDEADFVCPLKTSTIGDEPERVT